MARLFYVVGASGAGKDSVMRSARRRAQGLPILFAHRYVTRPPDPQAATGGESHVPVSLAEYTRMERAGLFALSWHSNGLAYGAGREIDLWMAAGLRVVVNGSRSYLPTALERYPAMTPVLIRADPDALAVRLAARGRETPQQIAQRLERGRRLDADMAAHFPHTAVVDNSGSLETAGEQLWRIVAEGLEDGESEAKA